MAFGGFAVVFGIIDFVQLSPWGFLYLALGALLLVRGYQSPSITIGEAGVTTRSFVLTRRYPYSELRGVEVAIGQTGPNGRGREYLVFHLLSGKARSFRELSSAPVRDGSPASSVRKAAACIRARLPH